MGKWIVIMTSIIVSQALTDFCRKKSSSYGGEELICHNSSQFLFKDPTLFMDKIQKLTCENCTIPTIDDLTFNTTKSTIHFLYLISSRIFTLKDSAFSKFRLLRVLNLRNNSITDIEPKTFLNLNRLAQLDLSFNNVRILINRMFEHLPNLNLLNLNYNTIYYIQPEAFRGLTHLRHLYLNNNRLEKLEGFVFKYLPNLLLLYLENNNIVQIDSFAFANLTNLNSLYLNNNNISFLTQYNFKPLTNLQDLQLRSNNLTEIQVSSFNGLINLKYLYLGNNHLRVIKRYGFVGLDHLLNLELINNELEIFDFGYIDNMKSLTMLWLQQNKISNLTADYKLDPLNSLISLGLNDNNFTILNYKLIYNKIPNLRDIFIFNNTWKCELLVNMFNFFQEKNVTVCASNDCNVNTTRKFVQDACVVEEQDKEEKEADFVMENASNSKFISVILFVINVKLLILV